MPVTINGTSGITNVDGTAAAPALTGTDTDTGIFFPAANTLAFSTAGTEDARFDSSGNFGIGTSSPSYKLQVNGVAAVQRTTDSAAISTISNETGNFVLTAYSGYNTTFVTSGSERMRLDSSGNLGLGTTSPNAITNYTVLQVGESSTKQGYIETYDGTTRTVMWTNGGVGKIGTRTAHPLTFQINSSEVARLDTSGNLGLGVTPSAWVSNFKAFQVGTGGTFYGDYNNTTSYFGNNAYFNGTNWKYVSSSYALYAYQDRSAGKHVWAVAASGTAGNNITWTEAMTLGADGTLGVGTTSAISADGTLVAAGSVGTGQGAANTVAQINIWETTSGNKSGLWFGAKTNEAAGVIGSRRDLGAITFQTYNSGWAERARIDGSGNLLVGNTTSTATPAQGVILGMGSGSAGVYIGHANGTSSGNYYMAFSYNGSAIGSITQNGTTAVAYNTSSDYRLKHDIQPMTGALAKVAALKPVTYKWNADNSNGEGFIAHELAEVCSHAVTGEKDAVDADGNPVYQGIDTSFLVATLTAAIKELKAEFDAYKATHP